MIPLTSDYSKSFRARAVPGARWDGESCQWVLDEPVTPRGALVALRLFPKLALTAPALVEARDKLVQNVRPTDYARQWWEAGGKDAPLRWPATYAAAHRLGLDPVLFQEQDIAYIAGVMDTHGAGYIGWERGLGKTMAALAIREALGAQRTLIITPNTSKTTVWEPKWHELAADFGVPFGLLPNDKAKREQGLLWIAANARNPMNVVVHYEQLALIEQYMGWKKLGEWDLVILDEAHHFANRKTKQSKALRKVWARHRLALSGSIIQNRADELFGPLSWLFPDRYRSVWRDWNDRFLDFIDLDHRVYIGVKIETLDALRDELGRYMVYRRGEDELDLPPVTLEALPVDLSSPQRRVYEELELDSIAELGRSEFISAASGGALITRLRQVATGLSLVSGELEDSSKLDVAADIVRENPDEPFVIFSYFKQAAYSLAERLQAAGIGTFVVTSNTPHAHRADYVRRFQAGECQAFIGTLGTLGESHTLDRAAQVLFLDRAWNPALNDQAIDRVAGGFRRKRHIHVTNLVARNTVDESNVTPVLNDKDVLRAMILGRKR
jgi:SNF2 family DNA or RNA helicase